MAMQPDPEIPSFQASPKVGSVPPLLPASEPPVIASPLAAASPPPLLSKSDRKSWSLRQLFALLLSLCLGLFLADAVVSLVDDSLLLFNIRVLAWMRGMLFLFGLLMALVIYGLMGLTPMIPKRLFLPVTLFHPLAALVVIPFAIYFYGRIQQIAWAISLSQVILGLGLLFLVQRG